MSIWQKLVAVIAETKNLKPCTGAKGIESDKYGRSCHQGKISMWWLHVDLLMQLTIKKDIVDIKLRDRPVASKYHNEKCAKSGHVGHMRKCLVVVIAMFLLKATNHKTSFVRQGNRLSLNLVDPLTVYKC